MSLRPHEEASSTGDTLTPQAADIRSSVASKGSTVFVGPILMSGQPQTPTTTMGTIRQHMPSFTVLMHKKLEMSIEFTGIPHHRHSFSTKRF